MENESSYPAVLKAINERLTREDEEPARCSFYADDDTVIFPHCSDAAPFALRDVEAAFPEMEECVVDAAAGIVRTPHHSFHIVVDANHPALDMRNDMWEDLLAVKADAPGGIRLTLARGGPIVTFAALKAGSPEWDYWAPSQNIAVDLYYADGKRLSVRDERELVDAFLFAVAREAGAVFSRGDLLPLQEDEEEADRTAASDTDGDLSDDEEESYREIQLDRVDPFNDGMPLFLAAMQVTDPALKLISLYKVLEHFTPLAWSLEAHEAMRRRLEGRVPGLSEGEYIKSLFDLARSFESRRSDRELIVLLFGKALDVVALNRLVPKRIRQDMADNSKRSDIAAYSRTLAETAYASRNQVAHAKATFKSTGKELLPAEYELWNRFLVSAAIQVIRWANALPAHQRFNLFPESETGSSEL